MPELYLYTLVTSVEIDAPFDMFNVADDDEMWTYVVGGSAIASCQGIALKLFKAVILSEVANGCCDKGVLLAAYDILDSYTPSGGFVRSSQPIRLHSIWLPDGVVGTTASVYAARVH